MRGIGKDLQAAFNLGYKARDEEIVRCKECKHRRHDGYCKMLLKNVSGLASQWFVPADGWHCADGERKDDAHE